MVTVILPTAKRPEMLRTALRSIERQTSRDVSTIIVSENGGSRDSVAVCAEFTDLPIRYVYREPQITPLEHGVALFNEARDLPAKYVAVLHDDDWWGINHIATGVQELERNPDAAAYWSASYLVHGESSWYMQCWNESCWIASGFAPLTEVVKFDRKRAAFACVASGPAHYSSLIGEANAVLQSYSEVTKSGNLHDNDRLLFLELSKHGALLINLVPEVFVRQHPAQDQLTMPTVVAEEFVAEATRIVLNVCKQEGLDIIQEFRRLYELCPVPKYRRYLLESILDPRVGKELHRNNALPVELFYRQEHNFKWFLHSVTPPVCWYAGKRLVRAATSAMHRSGASSRA